MHFYKYHGLGNDFILTPDLDGALDASPEQAARLCNRHTGIFVRKFFQLLRILRNISVSDKIHSLGIRKHRAEQDELTIRKFFSDADDRGSDILIILLNRGVVP